VTLACFDGEAVCCDKDGQASFDCIRYRRHNASVFLYAFDLIDLNGHDLRCDPLEVRRATLAPVLASRSGIPLTSIWSLRPGIAPLPQAWLRSHRFQTEGFALSSGRCTDWLKCKNRMRHR
jgi:bifunctional non-homologous end joining protein LigD